MPAPASPNELRQRSYRSTTRTPCTLKKSNGRFALTRIKAAPYHLAAWGDYLIRIARLFGIAGFVSQRAPLTLVGFGLV